MQRRVKRALLLVCIYEAVAIPLLFLFNAEMKRQQRQVQAFADANHQWPVVGEEYRKNHAQMLKEHEDNLRRIDRLVNK